MTKRAYTPRGTHDARVRELHAQGMGWSQIGREIGIAPQQACKIGRRLGLALDPSEVRARMSEARKKALADPEVRARMSEASKKALADPEVRARMSEARKKAWADPEVRARMSEASKKAHGLDRLWASVKPISDGERWRAQEVAASATHRFTILFRAASPKPTDRIVYEGRVHEISGVRELGFHEGWEITAAARAE